MNKVKEHPMQEHSSTLVVIFFLVIFALIALLTSCNDSANENKPEKPFVIIGRFYPYRTKDLVRYSYLDKKQNIFYFEDTESAYHIGDTIK